MCLEAVLTGTLLPVWLVEMKWGHGERLAEMRQLPHAQEVQLKGDGIRRGSGQEAEEVLGEGGQSWLGAELQRE